MWYAPMVDVAIVTVKREEFEALLQRFTLETDAPRPGLSTEYKFRSVSRDGQLRTVVITRCVMQGNGDSQTVIGRVIADLEPALVLVVGIAGMPPRNDLFLGDIVLGTHIHDFNLAAETQKGLEFAETGASPPYWLTRYVCNLDPQSPGFRDWYSELRARPKIPSGTPEFEVPSEIAWNEKIADCIRSQSSREFPKFIDGPIASSDDLLKNPDAVRKRLSVDRRIIAVEMESAGAARACNNVGQGKSPVPFLPIRAISDIVGLKRDSAWEDYACRSAASFALKFIETLPANLMRNQVPSKGEEITRAVASLCL